MTVEVLHAIPGRIRLRVPALKGEPLQAQELTERLLGLDVVREVEANAVTGTILVSNPAASEDALMSALAGEFPDLVQAADTAAPPSEANGAPTREVPADLLERIRAWVGGEGGLDLGAAAPIAVAGFGMAQLLRGAARTGRVPLPAWFTLLWFAWSIQKVRRGRRTSSAETDPPIP